MEVTPQTLREVEFREKLRGYHPDDVDEFLEKVAAGIEVLQRRLKEATDRAGRAEHQLGAAGELDDSVRRTLVLAQRTADLAIKEAREEAAKLVAHAEARARDVVAEAEERSRRATEEAQRQLRADLDRLEAARRQLQGDVGKLESFLAAERERIRGSVGNVLKVIDTALGSPTPAPSTTPVDVPAVGADRPQPATEPARPQPQFRPEPPPDDLVAQFPPDPAAPQGGARQSPRPAAVTAPQPRPQVQPQQQPVRQSQASPAPAVRHDPQPAPPRPGPPQPAPPRQGAVAPPRTGEPVPPPAPPRTMSTAPRQPSPGPAPAPPAAVDLERDDERDDAFFAELRRAITDDDSEPGEGADSHDDERRRLRGRRRR